MNESHSPSPTSSLKGRFLDVAEVLDALRVFPRLYLGFFLLFIWDLHQWYTSVAVQPDYYANLVFGAISALTGFYMGTGRKWGG
jgi:hypothetical protein